MAFLRAEKPHTFQLVHGHPQMKVLWQTADSWVVEAESTLIVSV